MITHAQSNTNIIFLPDLHINTNNDIVFVLQKSCYCLNVIFLYPIYMTIYHSKWVPLDMTHGDVFVVYIIHTDTAQLWLLLFILWWYWIFLSTYTRFTWLNLSQNIDYVITVMINIYSTPMYSNCWLIVSFSVALFSSNAVNILPT